MSDNRWSLSSDDSGWHPTLAVDFSQVPATKPEEIQIVLLGAPRTGKTRLQARYILRQFVDIDYEHAHRMGGHKRLRLLDGTEVHLIIHELRTARGRATTEDEDCRRKRLLERSDAVILTFNPWSRDSFEWISGKVVDDILDTGRKKQLTSDIFRLLDDLAAVAPRRTMSNRSALPFRNMNKRLPSRPDDAEDSDSELSVVSSTDEKRSEQDRKDYRGELKRISIVVEGPVPNKAEFMIHEKDLPSPPPQSPTPSPLYVPSGGTVNNNSKKLATINEVNEGSMTAKQVAVLMDKKYFPIARHDSAISIQSSMSASSDYSQSNSPLIAPDRHAPDSPTSREGHPALRPSTALSDVFAQAPYEELMRRRRARTPAGETEMPVLVVATMTDRLRDGGNGNGNGNGNGGTLERRVAADEGQRLARRFGPDCAYIETSARTNANVDEAYGIIVDQVMAKRAAARRDELARVRLEAAIQAIQAEAGSGGRGGGNSNGNGGSNSNSRSARAGTRIRPRARPTRTCIPSWGWLLAGLPVPSWSAIASALFSTGRHRPAGDAGTTNQEEDIWGEKAETKQKRHIAASQGGGSGGGARYSQRQSTSLSSPTPAAQQLMRDGTSASFGGPGLGKRLGARTMSHDHTQDIPLSFVEETTTRPASGQDEVTWQPGPAMPTIPAATYNPFISGEFERPVNMVTVTRLEEGTTARETKAQHRQTGVPTGLPRRPSVKSSRAQSEIIEGGLASLTRATSSASSRDRSSRTKSFSPAPSADVPVHRRSSQSRRDTYDYHHQHREQSPAADRTSTDGTEQIAALLSRDSDAAAGRAPSDSFVMMLSPTTATRTLRQFVREDISKPAQEAPGAGATAAMSRTSIDGGVVVPMRHSSRRFSAAAPEVASPPSMRRGEEDEDEDKEEDEVEAGASERETPRAAEASSTTVPLVAPTPAPAQVPRSETSTPSLRRARSRPRGSVVGTKTTTPTPPPQPHRSLAQTLNGRPLSAWI